MTTLFSENLRLVLKILSMSSARLASELETDKSVVSRWLKGSVQPSAHNLSRLSALMATRVEGFRTLDWERDPQSLAAMFGADPQALAARTPATAQGLPLAIWDQMVVTSAVRGKAYEGFFRSTRPHPRIFDQFLHEYGMIRRDEIGLLRLRMGSAESLVDGWMIPLHGLLYSISAEVNSGTLLFGIFNGVGASRVDIYDGLTLIPGADMGHSPITTAMICERVGDLTGDREIDDARCAELTSQSPYPAEDSVPEHIRQHLVRDIGPSQAAMGGDWLLSMSLARTMARGREYEVPKPGPKDADG
jgi:transcriptional regulator with XRE-family HTH domain